MIAGSARAAYGALGAHVAQSFDPGEPVICFDDTSITAAMRDAMVRRLDGDAFFVRAALRSPETVKFEAVTPSIVTTLAGIDDRRAAFEKAASGTLTVNNHPLAAHHAYAPPALRLLQGILRLADGAIVTSENERLRLAQLAETEPLALLRDLRDAVVPRPIRGRDRATRDAVVVWAPLLAGDVAASFAIALDDFRFPVVIVAASAPREPFNATWVTPSSAAQALERAKLIVDTTGYGSDAARALAAWDAPLVTDRDAGAHEFLEGVRTYDRRRFESIFDAVSASFGAPPPRERRFVGSSYDPHPLPADGPLVSIVLPTFDRPDLLAIALESVRRQTYRSVETLVAVDGGPRLDDLATAYPEVQFLVLPGPNQPHSTNAAFAAAQGEYIALLNDDDLYFPEHLALLVAALERSGAAVAHGDVLTAHLRKAPSGWIAHGLESNMSRSADHSSLLVSNRIGATSALIRRSVMGDTMMDAGIPLYRDYGLWLRLADRHDFVHVERITSCYTIRDAGDQVSNASYDKALASYEYLYGRFPVPGRPALEARRSQVMESVKRGDMMLRSVPAAEIEPLPWPPWTRR